MDPALKEHLLPHLSLAACCNRDRTNVETGVEICSPKVRQGLQKVNWIIQTLVPEVYRIYDGNKQGVLKSPVSVCPASWGMLLLADKEKRKIFSARLHYPVDVLEIVTGLNCPMDIAYRDGLLLVAEFGKKRIVCSDLTGDHFLNPEAMTVKQLRSALKDRGLLQQGNKSKKAELQKTLKTWIESNCQDGESYKSKLHTIEITNKTSIRPTAIVFSGPRSIDQFCAAEVSGQVHQLSLTIDGLKAKAEVLCTIDVQVDNLFGIAGSESTSELYISSSADDGGLFSVNVETGNCECLLENGSEHLKRIHGICRKRDGTVVLVDRDDKKVKGYNIDTDKMMVLAGSGNSGVKDGSETTACFSQPTAVCCEEGSDTIYVLDTSIGRLRMITSTHALVKFLNNLWQFLTAFQITSEDAGSYDDTIARTQEYYAFLQEATLKVQLIKNSTAQTQGPDGTLSSTTLHSIKMILEGLNCLKEKINCINPEYIEHVKVKSLLTLFVENLFSSMRAGNTVTPTMYHFCLRLPRCIKELLKRVTKTSFNYFTNPKASYYLQPSMKGVSISFSSLAKMPKPLKGAISQKHMAELHQWASLHGKGVRQNTTGNCSTKDKPATLPINIYQALPPKEDAVDFNAFSQDNNQSEDLEDGRPNEERNIIHQRGSYVVHPHSCRPNSVQTSTFYVVKLLEDLADDDHVTHFHSEWYSQDIIDPLLFTTTGQDLLVSKEGIKGTVSNVKSIADDTIELEENDYYILLALLHSSDDTTVVSEEDEPLPGDECEKETTDRPSSRPKRNRRSAAQDDFFFY